MSRVWNNRVVEASDATLPLTLRLLNSAARVCDDDRKIDEAIRFAAIQCDEEDDFDTWEATMLARLDDRDGTGER